MKFFKRIYAMWLASLTPGWCWWHAKPAVAIRSLKNGHCYQPPNPVSMCRYYPHKYDPICEDCIAAGNRHDQIRKEQRDARERYRQRRIAKLKELNA